MAPAAGSLPCPLRGVSGCTKSFVGNVDALDRPLHEAAVDWRADHDTKAFDSTLGYPSEVPEDPAPRAAGRNARARDG